MNAARVVIVEDHEMVREMVAAIVVEDLGHVVVAETSSMVEGIALCRRHQPNLVVLDWTLPDGRGFDIVRQTRPELPDTRWLCLSAHEQQHLIHEAVELNIHGFVLKRSRLSVLREAVKTVLSGDNYYCPSCSKLLLQELRHRKGTPLWPLTDRERDVLVGFARGKNTKEIAGELGLEVKTVHNHLGNLKDKLGIREPAGLVRLAIKYGLVEPP